jgi:hypothetical protein
VWADDDAVPKKWAMEASLDGETWEPFAKDDSAGPDSFSRWPGFEYYAPRPVKARYFKYKPLDETKRTIRLRLWSLYR